MCKSAYYLLVDPFELHHKFLMELFPRLDYIMLGRCLAYNLEMDGWSTKRGKAKVPIIPDGRPCLNNGFINLPLPVAERHYCSENTHCPLLFRSCNG